jgi:hypothetical protein
MNWQRDAKKEGDNSSRQAVLENATQFRNVLSERVGDMSDPR